MGSEPAEGKVCAGHDGVDDSSTKAVGCDYASDLRSSRSFLEELPAELLLHIALHCTANAILRLSSTSRKLRAICYDAQAFRLRLEHTQRAFWEKDCLDLKAIADTAGNEVQPWVRFAVADQCAWEAYCESDQYLRSDLSPECDQWAVEWESHSDWLPHLALVQHPVTVWVSPRLHARDSPAYVYRFCTLQSVLIRKVQSPMYCLTLAQGDDDDEDFAVACGLVPYVKDIIPNAFRCSSQRRTKSDDATLGVNPDLPLPFTTSYRSDSLAWAETTSPLATWQRWYQCLTQGMATSSQYMTSSEWIGVYTYGANAYLFNNGPGRRGFDPPMEKIYFRTGAASGRTAPPRIPQVLIDQMAGKEVLNIVSAHDCQDAVGTFSIRGTFYRRDDGQVGFTASKTYVGTNGNMHSLAWDCKLTPLGILGVWDYIPSRTMRKMGRLWLWRKVDC